MILTDCSSDPVLGLCRQVGWQAFLLQLLLRSGLLFLFLEYLGFLCRCLCIRVSACAWGRGSRFFLSPMFIPYAFWRTRHTAGAYLFLVGTIVNYLTFVGVGQATSVRGPRFSTYTSLHIPHHHHHDHHSHDPSSSSSHQVNQNKVRPR